MEKSLDGPFPKLCPAVTLSHQDGCHSAVALLLKAALIQVSDYRLLGASGWWRKSEYQEKTTDLSQVTDKLYQIMLYRIRIHHYTSP
jgi:hypothetical protein